MTSSQPHYLLLTHSAILQAQLLQNDSDFPTCLSACECKHTCTHTGAHMCALRAFARPGQARDSPSATSVRRTTSPAPPPYPTVPTLTHGLLCRAAGQRHFSRTAETLHARWCCEGTGSWWRRGAVGPKARLAESRLPAARPPHKTYSRVGEKHLIPWRSMGFPIMGSWGAQH